MNRIIYQTTATPDGILISIYGPVIGHRHDLFLLRQSEWETQLRDILRSGNEQSYIYGDSAYILRP